MFKISIDNFLALICSFLFYSFTGKTTTIGGKVIRKHQKYGGNGRGNQATKLNTQGVSQL